MLNDLRKTLNAAIKSTEFENKVFFAGGCVRDNILGKEIKDIDLAVELPDGGILLAQYLCQKGIATNLIIYKQFGTALVTMDNLKVELVMTRKESYRYKSRKPEVAFGTLKEDVMRRDFTVNSMLMRISDGEVLDLCEMGLKDIQDGLIRATSSPEIIFKEDPLRLMRAVRFSITLDFQLEKATKKAIKNHASEIKNISSERIADELLKIIADKNFISGIQLLIKLGIKQHILPNLRISRQLFTLPEAITQINGKKLLLPSISNLTVPCRLVLLFWLCKDCEEYLKLIKLSKHDRNHVILLLSVAQMSRHAINLSSSGDIILYRKIVYLLDTYLDEFIVLYPYTGLLLASNGESQKKDLETCQKLKNTALELNKYRFNLTGEDLIKTFCIQPGPKISYMISLARDYWFGRPQADKAELLAYLKSIDIESKM
jgi:poly(A) polymerase